MQIQFLFLNNFMKDVWEYLLLKNSLKHSAVPYQNNWISKNISIQF